MAVLNEEQTMLKDAAKSWAAERSPVGNVRKLRDGGDPLAHDPKLFAEMAEMGWTGVIIPEAYGGSEFGYLSLGLVLEELGRTLTHSPLLSSGLAAASAIVLGGREAQKQEWLSKIASGEVVATLAVDEGPRHAPEKTALAARKTGDGYTLSGTKRPVPDGMSAHLFVVAARVSGKPGEMEGIGLFLVSAEAQGVSRTPLKQADARDAAVVSFAETPAELLGSAEAGGTLLEQVLDRARAGQAAEMLGASAQAFDDTLDYLKTRVQFGQVIGTFQALQHRAADMISELELTRSSVEAALAAIDAGAETAPELVALAKIRACDTLHLISNEMVQMHGGIGMTDAHHAGFYLKRARAMEAAYGGASYHRERFGRMNGL